MAAFPDVSWLPDALTPGRFIFAVPSNDTPPIVLAFASAVAVSATIVRLLINHAFTRLSIAEFTLAVVW